MDNTKDTVAGIKETVMKKVERGFDTITGKAVLEQVASFAQEMDAVNTALATRIYELLDRQAKTEKEQVGMNAAILSIRKLVFVSIGLSLISLLLSLSTLIYSATRGR